MDIKKINEIAIKAGSEIQKIYNKYRSNLDIQIEKKEDNSPLTEADLASHSVIVHELKSFTPDIPVLSEEGGHQPYAIRKEWNRYWLIDPLDGTKEFIKKNGEFTVNIALIEKNEPILGVVYAPDLKVLWYGQKGKGSFKKVNEKEINISVSLAPTENEIWKIVGSRSHQSPEFAEYIKKFQPNEMLSMGSSLKICLIGEGSAHVYPRLGPTSEWDIAAAHGVLLPAGGDIIDFHTRKPIRYNQKEEYLNPFFIAAGESLLKSNQL